MTRQLILMAALIVGLAVPAWAGFDEGMAAYERGDYETALREWRPLAELGDADAQNNLGVIYSFGLGVAYDYVQGHLWLSLAAAQGQEEARKYRDLVEKKMSSEQIAEAQRLAREWKPKVE